MDIEKLIETLKNLEACAYGYHINGEVLGMDCSDFEQLMVDAAEEISKIPALQAENGRLRAELEQVKRERDAATSDLTYIARTYPVDLCDDLVCQYCKHYPNVNNGCPGWTENDCFEWRGQKEA